MAPTDIAIFAKAPIPGFAKTRLIPAIGAHAAAVLHERLTERAVATAREADLGPVTLWCAPDVTHRSFRDLGVALTPQPAGDLGARMLAAFEARPTLVIGTDCPALTAAHLNDAAAALTRQDVVLIPAEELAVAVRDLGGHDIDLLLDTYRDVDDHRPTVIFAYTVKGRGLPVEGHPNNHSALLTEAHALDPELPLARALGFWAGSDGRREAVAPALAALGLGNLADVPVRILSTGQRRRAAVARVVASGASMWLLDEPANGLDDAAVGTLEGLIADHRKAGGIALVATHLPIHLPAAMPIMLGDAP